MPKLDLNAILAPEQQCFVTSDGFKEAMAALCKKSDVVTSLNATHQVADTHLFLNCKNTESNSVVAWSRDTDVFVMLLDHSHSPCKNI